MKKPFLEKLVIIFFVFITMMIIWMCISLLGIWIAGMFGFKVPDIVKLLFFLLSFSLSVITAFGINDNE